VEGYEEQARQRWPNHEIGTAMREGEALCYRRPYSWEREYADAHRVRKRVAAEVGPVRRSVTGQAAAVRTVTSQEGVVDVCFEELTLRGTTANGNVLFQMAEPAERYPRKAGRGTLQEASG